MEKQAAIAQGTLILAGTGAVATGLGYITNGRLQDGLVLVAVGAAIVYWRELRKQK